MFDTELIKDYLYNELIMRGLVPDQEELEEIADIMFQFLVDHEIVEEL